MLSASGFTAATTAVRYLSSAEASAAASKGVAQPAAVPAEDTTKPVNPAKLAEVKAKAPASVQTVPLTFGRRILQTCSSR